MIQGMDDTLPALPDHRRLFEIAAAQHGHFTAAQATACGIGWDALSRGARSGRYRRVRRGVYRLRDFPMSAWEEVAAAWLAAGSSTSVVSHASALALLDLGDIVPDRVHLTVPRARRALPSTPGVAIHTSTRPLSQADIAVRQGFRITAPARTLIDVTESGIDPDHLGRAIRQAIDRGWTTPDDLLARAAERGRRVLAAINLAAGDAP